MQVTIDITESDLKKLAWERLCKSYPTAVTNTFLWQSRMETKSSYHPKELWRRPTSLRLHFEITDSL